MITMLDATPGTLVSFTDKDHKKYLLLRQYFGVIESPPKQGTVFTFWYEDEECTILKAKYEFYLHRLTLREPPNILPRTKLERKCRKLWNNSNWVKANPARAY